MTTCTDIHPAAHAQASALNRLGTKLANAWHGYWEYRANRAAIAMLQSMDGQALHDIGISRGEIEAAVYGRSREDARR